ncbi:MAG: ArsC/Spx/MgsR family protein [bacterium]
MELVENSGIPFEIVEYLKTPLSKDQLGKIVKGLGCQPLAIIRAKDKRFKELGLSRQDQRNADEWLTILADNPMLLERPIVVYKNRVALGRPPEKVLDILK